MRTRLCAAILAGAFLMTGALPSTSLAGRGRGKASGTPTQTRAGDCIQNQQRLRDGSCANQGATGAQSGSMQKKGKAYGPGDGTGNAGAGPKDGTGYGAPGQR